MDKTAGVCTGCSQGCNIHLDTRDNVVVRARPRANLEVNQYFMCDHGRMQYRWMNRGDRIEAPLVVQGDGLVAVSWDHAFARAAQILPLKMTSRESRDIVLLLARLARGLTLLTGGTAYDTATESYLNPSDWTDRPLHAFQIADHLRIEQVEGRADGKVWFHTRGLSKFGVEDLETYRARGLSERPVIEAFTEMADALTLLGRAPNVGESFTVPGLARPVRVVRHRTDQSYSVRLNLREVEWE